MRKILWLSVLLLSACGSGEDGTDGPAADINQIERLSTPGELEDSDPQASARPRPIAPADFAGLAGAGCDFRSNGELLLVTTGSDAVARIGGNLVHLIHSSPVGPSGGYFEDRGLSVSVGRTSETVVAEGETAGWPARATFTNRRTQAQVELVGTWTCGA